MKTTYVKYVIALIFLSFLVHRIFKIFSPIFLKMHDREEIHSSHERQI